MPIDNMSYQYIRSHLGMERLSKQDALKKLRWCLEFGVVEQHPHFKKALLDDGCDYNDALMVMKRGGIYDEPESTCKNVRREMALQGRG